MNAASAPRPVYLMLAGGAEAMSHHPVLWNDAMVAWLARFNWARGLSLASHRRLAAARAARS